MPTLSPKRNEVMTSPRNVLVIPQVLGPKRPAPAHVHGRFFHTPCGPPPDSLGRVSLRTRVALRPVAISRHRPLLDAPWYGEATDAQGYPIWLVINPRIQVGETVLHSGLWRGGPPEPSVVSGEVVSLECPPRRPNIFGLRRLFPFFFLESSSGVGTRAGRF